MIKIIPVMITFDGILYEPCRITTPKTYIIDKVHFKYNCLSLNFMNEKSCAGNFRLFYFNDDGKLELFYMQKHLPVETRNTSVLFT